MSKEVKRYEALRDAAKKATPGPWRIEDDEDSAAGAVYITHDTPGWREPIARLYGWHDQNYLEVADPTTILELLAERDALLAEREMLKAALDDIGGLSRALRQGGPDPMDLQGLSNALEEAIGIAHDAISALQGEQQ